MSEALFADNLEKGHYVNADTIARGLSAFRSEEMARRGASCSST